MGISDTIHWARREWGILTRGHEMSATERLRWLRQWVPFGVRTIMYGSISLALGPWTEDHRASLWAMKRWSERSLVKLKIPYVLEGAHLVPGGGLMYASNHQSLLDILVLGAALPGNLKWATKRSIMKIPFLGWHLSLSGHVPVDRKAGNRSAAQAIKQFTKVLADDHQLLIFPEGTRTQDGAVKPFKNGGFYAAVRANKPVVPVALDGTYFLMGKYASDSGSQQTDLRRVHVRIGEPLFAKPHGKERERVEELRDRAHAAVRVMHRELRAASPWADHGECRTASETSDRSDLEVRP